MLTKVCIVKAMVFSVVTYRSNWIWELEHIEGWAPKNWRFWTVVLEKTLESPLQSKEIKPVNLKEINPEYSLKGLMLELQSFGHPMWRSDSVEKILILGKIEGRRRRRRWQRMRWLDAITDTMDMNVSKLWERMEDRGACVLQSMGSQSWTQLSNWTAAKIMKWCEQEQWEWEASNGQWVKCWDLRSNSLALTLCLWV